MKRGRGRGRPPWPLVRVSGETARDVCECGVKDLERAGHHFIKEVSRQLERRPSRDAARTRRIRQRARDAAYHAQLCLLAAALLKDSDRKTWGEITVDEMNDLEKKAIPTAPYRLLDAREAIREQALKQAP